MAWKRAGNISARIRDLRGALGQTQEQFGEIAGVEGQQVSEWENRRSKPSQPRLERLARRLQIPLTVFEEGGPMPSAAVVGNGRTTLEEIAGDPDYEPEGPGWLFGDPTESEEFMRTVLRNLERTTRAMVGRPDLFSSEDLRLNRLGVMRAAMHSHELAGKQVPRWLRELYDQVSDGRFR